jgi:hypothetical protein
MDAAVSKAQMSLQSKLNGSNSTRMSNLNRRPPSPPVIPAITINRVISNLVSVKADLDTYAAHIKSWSFAEGKTPTQNLAQERYTEDHIYDVVFCNGQRYGLAQI